jgi:Na+/H+-dicarboxylate symporter
VNERNLYLLIYTTIYAVVFGVIVDNVQEQGAFATHGPDFNLFNIVSKLFVSIISTIVLPAVFFIITLPVIHNKFPNDIRGTPMLFLLFWVTPVYGLQHMWIIAAKWFQWSTESAIIQGHELWWFVVLVVFGVLPGLTVKWIATLSKESCDRLWHLI